jgi:hypothetical protein
MIAIYATAVITTGTAAQTPMNMMKSISRRSFIYTGSAAICAPTYMCWAIPPLVITDLEIENNAWIRAVFHRLKAENRLIRSEIHFAWRVLYATS